MSVFPLVAGMRRQLIWSRQIENLNGRYVFCCQLRASPTEALLAVRNRTRLLHDPLNSCLDLLLNLLALLLRCRASCGPGNPGTDRCTHLLLGDNADYRQHYQQAQDAESWLYRNHLQVFSPSATLRFLKHVPWRTTDGSWDATGLAWSML